MPFLLKQLSYFPLIHDPSSENFKKYFSLGKISQIFVTTFELDDYTLGTILLISYQNQKFTL